MNTTADNNPFILRDTDEPHLAKIKPHLVEALRKVHAPSDYATAALELGVPLGTVKSRVHRARFHVLKMRHEAAVPDQAVA